MIDRKYIVLIHKHLRKELTEGERTVLEQWIEQEPLHRKVYQELEQSWKLSKTYRSTYTPDVEAGLKALKGRMAAEKTTIRKPVSRPVRPIRTYVSIAATVLLLLLAGVAWNTWFASEDTFTAQTGPGETTEFILEDGSRVILNENSFFSYPESFGKQREVYLEGEAFFEVSRDITRTFRIQTPMATTEVLGTSFNLRAYETEAYTEVEVVEGTVRLQPKDSKEKLPISAGDRGVYEHEAGKLRGERPKTLNALYWKNGLLRFRNHTLEEALEEVYQRLGIRISLQEIDLAQCPITTGVPLGDPHEIVAGIAGIIDGQWEQQPSGQYIIMDGICPEIAE